MPFGSITRVFEGAFLGFIIAAPIGPISLLCLQRTLVKGRASGFATGFGIASADFVYGAIASFGLTSLTGALTGSAFWLRLSGGIYLIYLGAKIFLSPPPRKKDELFSPGHLASDSVSAFFLTLTNPMTILSFTSMFAANATALTGNWSVAAFQSLGVFLGSGIWWIFWSVTAAKFRSRIVGENTLRIINKISGAAIIACALYVLTRAFTQ
jgi:threonine/homoserine/homoserine lactone efflux protein